MRIEPSPPIALYGQWAVYPNRLFCALAYYEITAYELEGAIDWERHLSEKRWCNVAEFCRARDHLLGLRIRQEAA